jgi:hypothetical protein
VVGFETLTGTQDVRRGFQFGTVFGPGRVVPRLRGRRLLPVERPVRRRGLAPRVRRLRGQVEGRRESRTEQWNGIVASGRAAGYLVPDARWRMVLDAEYGGTWRPRIPVQLEIGGREGGVRGFDGADVGGGMRAVARLEARYVLGQPFGLGDLGSRPSATWGASGPATHPTA